MKSIVPVLLILLLVSIFPGCKKEPTQYELKTSALPTEGGIVSPASGLFKDGESIVLTAIPSSEYLFTGWSDGATGTNNPLKVVMDSKKTITTNFEKRKYPLSLTIDGDGTVAEEIMTSLKSTSYSSGTIVKLTANPNIGSSFVGWAGDLVSTENPVLLTINGAKNVTVNFKKNYYSVKINTVGEGKIVKTLVSGTISDSSYIHGSVIKIEAQPSLGWKFMGWSGDIKSNELTSTLTITGKINATATFEKIFILQTIYDTSTKNHE